MKLLLKFNLLMSVLWFSLISNLAIADRVNMNQNQRIDGVSIYLGIIPAEIIEGTHANNMHGGLPAGQFRYHVTIALFTDSGKRLDHANISVRLATSDKKTEFKTLEEMDFNKNLVYGNFFTLSESGPYRIEVVVKHPDYPKPIKAEFQYLISHALLTTDSLYRFN